MQSPEKATQQLSFAGVPREGGFCTHSLFHTYYYLLKHKSAKELSFFHAGLAAVPLPFLVQSGNRRVVLFVCFPFGSYKISAVTNLPQLALETNGCYFNLQDSTSFKGFRLQEYINICLRNSKGHMSEIIIAKPSFLKVTTRHWHMEEHSIFLVLTQFATQQRGDFVVRVACIDIGLVY